YPVTAYQMVPFNGGTAAVTSATLLLPTSAWGTNYIAINAYKQVPETDPNNPFNGNPSLAVVAKEDATKVTLLPNVNIVGGPNVAAATANTQVTYTLNAGQFLQITQPMELTGSPLNADKPVGVFGASTCMRVPTTQSDCDSGQQQLPPIGALGSEYVAVRHKSRNTTMEEPGRWRLVGVVKDTMLTWLPAKPPDAPTSINLGEVIEFQDPGPYVVTSQDADHPFYLGAYMTGGAPFANVGDPEWHNVVPPQQYLRRYVLFTDPTYPETSLVVTRVRSKTTKDFVPVTLKCRGELTGWVPLGDDYEWTRVDLVTGNFVSVDGCTNGPQEMTSTAPFGVTVWGWGTTQQTLRVSYAYPAGAGFKPINEIFVPPTPN
ncbi:MAG TPA: IgGFc-binding protein, partial [Polyangium sp.]|nr:IgGFc-binding protein [Polyangium sp.]